MLPTTPLLVAPSDAIDTLGTGMLHRDLIRGLRNANPNLCIPDPSTWEGWYPGRAAGMTSIWWGQPPHAPKICAFHLGVLPEFTQVTPDGILRRGWRDVLARVIKIGAASRESLERQFKVSLLTGAPDTKACSICRLDGLITTTEKDGLCAAHYTAKQNRERAAAQARDQRRKAWLSP